MTCFIICGAKDTDDGTIVGLTIFTEFKLQTLSDLPQHSFERNDDHRADMGREQCHVLSAFTFWGNNYVVHFS